MTTAPRTMHAWRVVEPGPVTGRPLQPAELPVPAPASDELLVRVLACGVCRTDLHVTEGDLPVHRVGVVPGHEVVGEVAAIGSAVSTDSPPATRWASPGSAAPAGPAPIAGAGRRTCARTRRTPAGTPTAATPRTSPSRPTSPTGCRTGTRAANWRRCCARASSATGCCAAAAWRTAGGWASTGSGPACTGRCNSPDPPTGLLLLPPTTSTHKNYMRISWMGMKPFTI